MPNNALIYVPRNSAERPKTDLKTVGIPIKTEAGKLDFHALRTACINLVIETGADLKAAQTMARHATPDLTINVYGRSRDSALRQAAEAVGNMIFRDGAGQALSQNSPETNRIPRKNPGNEKTATLSGEVSCGYMEAGEEIRIGQKGKFRYGYHAFWHL